MDRTIETPISFLKPESLLRAEQLYNAGQTPVESLKAEQDQAVKALVEAQKAAGLKIITDGAFHNLNGLREFWMELEGVTPTVVTSGHVYQNQNAGEVIPRVTGKIAYNPAHSILDNFSFLHREAGAEPLVRMDLPAPSQLLVEQVRNQWYDTHVYSSIEELAEDIAKAYNQTIKALYELGCRRLLLNDPSWSRLCDPYAFKCLVQGGLDLVDLPKIMFKVNEEALKGLPKDMHVILYTPLENPKRDNCTEVFKNVLSLDRVDSFMIDWPVEDKDGVAFIKHVPNGKEVIIGISTTNEPQLDDKAYINAVKEMASNANPSVTVRLTTRGGFVNNTDYIDFSTITETDQWNKVRQLVELGRN